MKRFVRCLWLACIVLLAPSLALGGLTGCAGEDCLYEGQNCSKAYLEKNDLEDAECCDDMECCYLPNGISVPTCNPSHRCE